MPWQQIDDFYTATYARLVAAVTLATGSRSDAEDLVQEAFIRLLPRWDSVSRYEDPEGWVRSAAMRRATSRWRRARVAAAVLLRLGSGPAPITTSANRMEVTDLLMELPIHLRQVLVLHYGVGLNIREVAAELGIAEGTVKSRLSRARQAARQGAQLSEDSNA